MFIYFFHAAKLQKFFYTAHINVTQTHIACNIFLNFVTKTMSLRNMRAKMYQSIRFLAR